MTTFTALVLTIANANEASADIVEFVFGGVGGSGVLAINEPANTGNGSGGLLSPMLFDTDTNELFIDAGWGSGNGFADLSSAVNLLNIHGPTIDGAPDSYGQNAGALFSLPNVDPSPTSGGFTGTVDIPAVNVQDLFDGKLYLHVLLYGRRNVDALGCGQLPSLKARIALSQSW